MPGRFCTLFLFLKLQNPHPRVVPPSLAEHFLFPCGVIYARNQRLTVLLSVCFFPPSFWYEKPKQKPQQNNLSAPNFKLLKCRLSGDTTKLVTIFCGLWYGLNGSKPVSSMDSAFKNFIGKREKWDITYGKEGWVLGSRFRLVQEGPFSLGTVNQSVFQLLKVIDKYMMSKHYRDDSGIKSVCYSFRELQSGSQHLD